MVELSESLECLFTAPVEEETGTYIIELPRREIELGTLSAGDTYRVAVLPQSGSRGKSETDPSPGSQQSLSGGVDPEDPPEPPVSEGETRRVEIEALGEQGDGIAKIERGYVVIVPNTTPGDEVLVEINTVRTNVSFAEAIRDV